MRSWSETLEGLAAGEIRDRDRVVRLVTGTLEALGAYVVRDSWEDVAQEVLLVLVDRPPRSRDDAAVLAYVRRTTHRLYIDGVRRERGRRRKTGDDASIGWRRHVPLNDVIDELHDTSVFEERLDLGVRAALDALSDRRRRVLECKYFLGHTDPDGAVKLGESLGTYKRLAREALAELRAVLLPDREIE